MNTEPHAELSSDALLRLEQRLADEARLYAVATVIRALPPTSTWVGAQALVESDGTLHGWIGGGCSRAIVVQAALDAMQEGQPKLMRISNTEDEPEPGVEHHAMPCASNGTIELFIQPSVPAPAVLIVGATPAALEAFVLAQRMGLRAYPAVAAASASQASEPFTALGAQRVIRGFDADAFRPLAPQLILIATQGDGDEDALEASLRTSAAAVLLIASRRKADQLRETMRLRGIPDERLAALHAPAGPRIHARTPQEIALGAVAGLIELRRTLEETAALLPSSVAGSSALPAPATTAGTSAAHTVTPLTPCESMGSVAPPARYVNPVCGMAVEVASAKHVVERDGQRVYFCCDGCLQTFERTPERYLAIARGTTQREAV